MSTDEWRPVTAKDPCPKCGKPDWCCVSADGHTVICRRAWDGAHRTDTDEAGVPFYVHHLNGYRHQADPFGARKEPPPNGQAYVDWKENAKAYALAFTAERRRELAESLGLPEWSLDALDLIGWMPSGPHLYDSKPRGPCHTSPERDGSGNIVGILCRYQWGQPDGKNKLRIGGSKNALTIAEGWRDREGPVLIAEGPSDVLALTAVGLAAIGRPSNYGGVDYLVELLKGLPADRTIIVVGEWDPKPDGRWPGKEGAVKTASELSARLGRPVPWALPPDGIKDARKWVIGQDPPDCSDGWHELGERFIGGLKQQKAPALTTAPSFNWEPTDSAALAGLCVPPRWLVKRCLVEGQPGVIGGPKKALKTSFTLDLAVSLASATPFLGTFDVYHRRRVAVLSGESGRWTIRETALRICQARGIDLASLRDNLLWHFTIPQLGDGEQVSALQAGLVRDRVEVLMYDPLYLGLLCGGPKGQAPKAENLFEIGPLLLAITRACLDVGATPLLVHHTKKGNAPSDEPLDLDDLSYAGIAEFARQWFLISRRQKFEPGTGMHNLLLNVGGSCGQGGLWAVDVDEGQLGEDFAGRKWGVTVSTAGEAREIE